MPRIGRTFLKTLGDVAAKTVVFDDELKGFGIVARLGGRTTFFVDYRAPPGGRTAPKRRWTIGTLAETSPEAARESARGVLARVRLGQDPVAGREAAREAMTVAELADAFLSEHVKAKRKERTQESYEQALRTWVRPHLGSRKAETVKRADVAKLHAAVAAGKGGAPSRTGRPVSGGPTVANRVVMILGSLYAWAEKRGLLPEDNRNPARGIEKFRERSRERFLDGDELARLADALALGTTEGLPWWVDRTKKNAKHMRKDAENQRVRISPQVASAIRVLVFTGARRNEITKLRWDEVDLKQGLLKLKDSKTGAKTIILNPPAIAILAELPKVGTHVFPSRADPVSKPMDNFAKAWGALIRQAGLPGLRIHDLRHTHASAGVADGMSLPMVGKLLGHKSTLTTQRYAHLALDPVREASRRIGVRLAEAMAGGRAMPRGGGNVVELRREGGHGARQE